MSISEQVAHTFLCGTCNTALVSSLVLSERALTRTRYLRHGSAAPALQVNSKSGASQQKNLFRFKCHLHLSVFIPLLEDLFLLNTTYRMLCM